MLQTRTRRAAFGIILLALAGASILTLKDVRLASSQTVTLVARRSDEPIPLDDPSASVWKRGAPVELSLSGQSAVPPKGGGAGTITARALHDGQRLYIQAKWQDDTEDARLIGQTEFSDAVAVQFPVAEGEKVPAFCMGDPNAPVNIWQWKAAWQADIEEGFVDVGDAHPNAAVDLYPFEDEDAFYPARAAGNVFAELDRSTAVDNLLAGSFGTLTQADDQLVEGTGEWGDGEWTVVFARDLAVEGEYTQFEEEASTNIALAVWDGADGERDGIKSVSQLATIEVSPEIAEAPDGLSGREVGLLVVAALAVVAAVVIAILLYIQRGRAW